MIKWFDADKFLPGRNCGEVLARVTDNSEKPLYYMAVYGDGDWGSDTGDWLESEGVARVTHWAHINEPFE